MGMATSQIMTAKINTTSNRVRSPSVEAEDWRRRA